MNEGTFVFQDVYRPYPKPRQKKDYKPDVWLRLSADSPMEGKQVLLCYLCPEVNIPIMRVGYYDKYSDYINIASAEPGKPPYTLCKLSEWLTPIYWKKLPEIPDGLRFYLNDLWN